MDQEMRQCRQCGEIKVMTQFRRYYNSRKGHYRVCLTCEKINTRHKYLRRKSDNKELTQTELQELEKIERLYDVLRERGLRPPARQQEVPTGIDLDAMLELHESKLVETQQLREEGIPENTPVELLEWLNKDLDGLENWELEDIYDNLEDRHRPQIGVDENYKPVFDDTYKTVLDKIRERFGV